MDHNGELPFGMNLEKRFPLRIDYIITYFSVLVISAFNLVLAMFAEGFQVFSLFLWGSIFSLFFGIMSTWATAVILTETGMQVEYFLLWKRFIPWDEVLEIFPHQVRYYKYLKVISSQFSFIITLGKAESNEFFDAVIENAGLVPASESKLDIRYIKKD